MREAELELRKEFDNRVAAFRMREVRGTWTQVAVAALSAIASVVTPEAAAELALRGYAVVDIGGERTVIAPPDDCIPLILRVTSIADEVDQEATEIASRRPIKDVDALLRKRIVEAVREGELA